MPSQKLPRFHSKKPEIKITIPFNKATGNPKCERQCKSKKKRLRTFLTHLTIGLNQVNQIAQSIFLKDKYIGVIRLKQKIKKVLKFNSWNQQQVYLLVCLISTRRNNLINKNKLIYPQFLKSALNKKIYRGLIRHIEVILYIIFNQFNLYQGDFLLIDQINQVIQVHRSINYISIDWQRVYLTLCI